jgi:putative NIF3 family GTP cyclohydrolase 1 type 2
MSERNLSRRKFCQFAGSGVLALPSVMHAQVSGGLTAREVVARIRKNIGIPWRTPTSDTFKIGDPDVPITGITTTFMSTLDVLKRSAAAGHNFVITHEPTFWSADDVVKDLRDDPLYRYKVDFIEKNRMVVWRFHDNWHARHPDGIFAGWDRTMGWDGYAVSDGSRGSHQYLLPETTVEQIAKEMQSKLKVRSARIVGDPKMKVTRVGNAGHYISQCMEVLPKVDALIVFESREWEAAEYLRDAVAAGEKKALIQLPHEGGEEAGMDECARWLRPFISEVPIGFIPAGDPFWMPT